MSDIYIGPGITGATFSSCRNYRYSLWRRWEENCDDSGMVAFIGLNPSTADENKDDPTIRRCIGYAKEWGYGGLVMLNLFAFRATDPAVMRSQANPVGDANGVAIFEVCKAVKIVVCAWGVHGQFRNRGSHVGVFLAHNLPEKLFHLGLTKEGFPKHPLYLRKTLTPTPWRDEA